MGENELYLSREALAEFRSALKRGIYQHLYSEGLISAQEADQLHIKATARQQIVGYNDAEE